MTVYGIQFWIECKGGLKSADELSDALDYLVYDGNLSLGYSNHSIMGAGLFMKNAVQNNFEIIREILNEFADKIKYVSEWDYENSSDVEWGTHALGESKKSARKTMKEQFVGKGEGGYRKPDKTKFNSGICFDSNGVKHTVIFDTHVEDFIVWVDNDNYLMWYVSSPQSLLNNLAESDLDENLILDIVALWEKLPKKCIKK
jgi:hypothetical protein